jgi:CspA family cold shock protein
MKGKVKFFNQKKRYGFIAGDDGTDYFVHVSDLSEGVELDENVEVEFDVVEGQKGPKAGNVSLA